MLRKGEPFSVIRLNTTELGYGVIDDATGALTHIDGLAMRLNKERVKDVTALSNAEAKESDTAAVPVNQPIGPTSEPEPA